eukprot:scaffold1770_cov375-Prasinococcus_capsulatus_cf.AAC.28
MLLMVRRPAQSAPRRRRSSRDGSVTPLPRGGGRCARSAHHAGRRAAARARRGCPASLHAATPRGCERACEGASVRLEAPPNPSPPKKAACTAEPRWRRL